MNVLTQTLASKVSPVVTMTTAQLTGKEIHNHIIGAAAFFSLALIVTIILIWIIVSRPFGDDCFGFGVIIFIILALAIGMALNEINEIYLWTHYLSVQLTEYFLNSLTN